MAGGWEPVGKNSEWTPVGREDINRGLGELGLNIAGSADAILGAVPRMIASGVGGLAAGVGSLAGGASLSEAGQDLQDAAAKPFGPEGHFTEKGPMATEALGHYTMTVPGEALGNLLAQPGVNPAVNMRTMPQSEMLAQQTPGQEAVTRTIGENIIPVAGVAALRAPTRAPKPQLTPEAQKYLADKIAADKAARPWEPVGKIGPDEPVGNIPNNWREEAPRNIQAIEQAKASGIETGAVFEPEVKSYKGPSRYEPTPEIEAALTDLNIPKPEAKQPTFPEAREGTMDFPFRQEALERDPHIYDLREQYSQAVAQGNLRRAKTILANAENYLDRSYNIRSTLGPMYESGRGTALPIEPVREGVNRDLNVSKWKKQGGVIDRDLLTFGVASLLEEKSFPEVMKQFRGTFSHSAIEDALKDSQDAKSRHTLVFMSPDKFLELAQRREEGFFKDEQARVHTYREGKRESIRDALNKEGGLNDLPRLAMYIDNGQTQIFSHEGRHRADVFKEQGLDLMPVLVTHKDIRWGETPSHLLPKEVVSENGVRTDFPSPANWGKELDFTGGSQRGSIGIPRDPRFEAFKDSLPEALKSEAKLLYKEYTKEQQPRPEVVVNENALTAAKDIPGLKDIFSEIAPIEKSVEELKPFILKEEDLGGDKAARLGRQMVAGVKLLGFGTQNTVVRLGGQVVDGAMRRAEKFMREEVQKKDVGLKARWEKLTSKEQDSLWPAMIAAEGKEVLSKERLLQLGMSDKQMAAYGKYREVMDKVFGRINAARESIGKKPIPARQGYIMSRFLGDFKIDVTDAAGNRIHSVGATTQWGAERAAALLKERYPELTLSKVRHEPIHRIGSTDDATKGFQSLLHMLDDEDPRVAAIESTMQEFINGKGYDVLGYKRHFIPKSEVPVKGFEGNKEWQTQRQNTKEGLHATLVYIDQAMKWAELQEANKTIKQLLSDKEIVEKQPNATDFVKGYFDQVAGRSQGLTKAIDTIADFVAENTGIGHSLQTRSLRETKQFFTSLYLGFWNLGFSASQILQPIQMLPPWFHYLHRQGATKALPEAMAGGMRDAVWYGFNNEKMSGFGKEAMKYADDFGITDAHFLDDVRSINESKAHDWYTKISTYNMTAPEKVARRMTYLMFSHFLNANGMKMSKKLFETAANLTDMSMVDYRLHERANMYKSLGVIGESASALTTFKHNYYSQMWALGKRGGAPVLGSMIGMSMLFAGMMGFYGREEVDAIINLINEFSPKRVPTMTEIVLKTPDLVAFGGLSAATGLDMSPKFSMSNLFPDSLSKAIFPFGTTTANVAKLATDLINNPTKSQGMRIAHEVAPGPVKAATEQYFSTPEMTLNPKTMEGKYSRTPAEQAARYASLRSVKESRTTQENFQKKNADAYYVMQRENLARQAKDKYFEGKLSGPEWKQLADKYIKNEGDVGNLVDQVVSNIEARKQTEVRRTLLNALDNPVRYKRLKDMTSGEGIGPTGTGGWKTVDESSIVSDTTPPANRWIPKGTGTKDEPTQPSSPRKDGTKDRMPMIKEDDMNLMIKRWRT